jgi:mannose-6-phosphate isomerase-like protein (cupin superfamily)
MPSLLTHPIHIGAGGTAIELPEFTGMEWYDTYGARFPETDGRLVSMYSFTEDWTSWEMHPVGAEIVLCVAGAMVIHQEMTDGTKATVALAAGDYAINPPGAWHTADVAESATAVFVTTGWGTEHRAR